MIKSARYLNQLKRINSVQKMASPGERVISSLFPNRHYMNNWSADLTSQVAHYRQWTYVAVHTICSRLAGLTPNMAYVYDESIPGRTVKACQRGLMSLQGRGMGGTGLVGSEYKYKDKALHEGGMWDYNNPSSKSGYELSGWGAHSWLTMGEYRSKALSVVKPHEDLEPIENEHPLRRLFDNPNPVDTSFDILYETQMFQELTGVSYLWVVPNTQGVPCELWCIPSHWVWPRTSGGKEVSPAHPHAGELIEYYEIRPWGGTGGAGFLRFPPNEVIMERWKSPMDKINGYSKLTAGAQWIDTEESITRSRWSQFINQAMPGLWLELGSGYEDPDDNEIARIEAKFAARFQGENNFGRPIITPPGAKVTALGFSPTEMSYKESEGEIRDMILSLFQVPKAAVGISEGLTYGCLDNQSECLTARGWKKYTELTLDTQVACYDPDRKVIVYRKPSNVFIKHYKGKMHRWKGQRLDSLLTPEHRVYMKKRGSQSFEIKEMKDITAGRHFTILGAAPAACDTPHAIDVDQYGGGRYCSHEANPLTIDPRLWLEFIGYFISEGHATKPKKRGMRGGFPRRVNNFGIDITQRADSPHTPKIQSCLDKLPFGKWGLYKYDGNHCNHWRISNRGLHDHLVKHCGQGSVNKKIPDYVKSWPAEDLRVLFDALMAGDGRKPRKTEKGKGWRQGMPLYENRWQSSYRTISPQLADDVMELAIKCGLSAFISKDRDDVFTVNITTNEKIVVMPYHRSEENYEGDIWCVTVPTGLFIARRNGKAQITGNSVLATLASMCSQCINPRLTMRGQTLTKHLASRWSKPGKRVKLWWDDTMPADPAQVNSDITCDLSAYSITPNEVRALRGRASYKHGGDDPVVMGPGGPMPFPINTGEDIEDLAELIKPFAQPEQAEQQAEEGGMLELPEQPTTEGTSELPEAPEIEEVESIAPEEPNGKPSKSVKKVDKGFTPVASGLAVMAYDTGRVLMLQRHIDDNRGGTWEFPGGKIEGDTDPLESAKREWYEETGIELPTGKLVDNWQGTNGKYQGFVYLVPKEDDVDIVNRRLDTNPDGDVFEVVAWVSPKDFDNHNLRPELLADLIHLQRATTLGKSLKYLCKHIPNGRGRAVVKSIVKTEGSCKPGERADLTGCTPLSGGGGSNASQPKRQGKTPLQKLPKVGSSVTVNGGKYTVESTDTDYSFPPAIKAYALIDGYMVYEGRDGSEGVVSGTEEEIADWVKSVDKNILENPPEDSEITPWNPSEGGKEFIEMAKKSAEKAAETFGIKSPTVNFGSRKSAGGVGGDASHEGVSVVNAHKNSPAAFLFKSPGVTQGMRFAAHEVSHHAYSSDPALGKKYADKLAKLKDNVSVYGGIAGKLEGLMEASAAYVTAPQELKEFSPSVYNLVEEWARDLRSKGNVDKSSKSIVGRRKILHITPSESGGSGQRTKQRGLELVDVGQSEIPREIRDKGGYIGRLDSFRESGGQVDPTLAKRKEEPKKRAKRKVKGVKK